MLGQRALGSTGQGTGGEAAVGFAGLLGGYGTRVAASGPLAKPTHGTPGLSEGQTAPPSYGRW